MTTGEHLRKVRLDRGLEIQEVAELVNVTPDSISNWERGRSNPQVHMWPKLIAFLGYDPIDEDQQELSSKLTSYRRKNGLTRRQLAHIIGVDENTVYWWERGRAVRNRKVKEKLATFLDNPALDSIYQPQSD